MAEFPLLLGSGVDAVEGVALLLADDGLIYHQDADGNRVAVGAALAGVVTDSSGFFAVGHQSFDDGSGGAYVDHTALVLHSAKAPVYATGPADTDEMQAGNYSVYLDLENSQLVVVALDDDGNEITGSVALT